MAVVRPDSVQQARILRLLRDDGPRSRAELGDLVELSRSRLAVELERLVRLELVETAGPAASRGGRRSSIVQIARQTRFLGIDIGATSIDIAVTDGELRVLSHVAEPIDIRQGPEVVISIALQLVGKLRADDVAPGFVGAAAGVPGPVSFREGVPVSPPIMPGWNHFPVRETFGAELGCPVLVDNDVNIMALGERHAGIAKSVDDFLFVKIGTGIGCGIIVGGEVYRGVSGSAGDIGHIRVDDNGPICMCGNTGCLEAFFGGTALCTRRACRRSVRTLGGTGTPAGARRDADRGGRSGSGSRRRPGRCRDDPRRWAPGRAGARWPGELLQPRAHRDRRRRRQASGTRCSPRSAAWSTPGPCRWPRATCRSCCPSLAAKPAWSARPGSSATTCSPLDEASENPREVDHEEIGSTRMARKSTVESESWFCRPR